MITRIRQLLEHKQLTPTQFADLIGVGRPVVSHILSERNKPSLEVAQRIGSAFPDISLAWLLFGTGEMLAAAGASPSTAPAPAAEPSTPAPVSEAPLMPPPLAEAVPSGIENGTPKPIAYVVPPTEVTPLSAPLLPSEALPRPFVASQPAPVAPLAPLPKQRAEPTPLSIPISLPEAAPNVVPAAPQPFRAARFVPSVQAAPIPAPEPVMPPAAPVLAPEDAAPPVALQAPELPLAPATTAATVPTATSSEAAMLPFLAESGKAIRRIVIFYRDGSFADYQPE